MLFLDFCFTMCTYFLLMYLLLFNDALFGCRQLCRVCYDSSKSCHCAQQPVSLLNRDVACSFSRATSTLNMKRIDSMPENQDFTKKHFQTQQQFFSDLYHASRFFLHVGSGTACPQGCRDSRCFAREPPLYAAVRAAMSSNEAAHGTRWLDCSRCQTSFSSLRFIFLEVRACNAGCPAADEIDKRPPSLS